jgi:hypothetical protein
MPWTKPDNLIPSSWEIAARAYSGVILLIGMLFLIVSGALALYAVRTPRPLPPGPMMFSQDEYTPSVIDLCPGDSLVVDVTRTVRRTTTISYQTTWYNVTASASALTLPATGPSGVTPDSGVTHRVIPLPPDVRAPGEYEYRQVIWQGGPQDPQSEAVGYTVPFRLKS